jgi:CheY-like chemotaxis protein
MPVQILVVEDDPLNRFALCKLLQKNGYTVLEAENGRQALEVLAQKPVDCILMDIQLPEMNGVEATKAIRGHEGQEFDPRIPIIALTAYAMPGDRETFLDAGMNAYLSKPVTIEQVRKVLEDVLEAKTR